MDELIEGKIQYIIFHNPETGFFVGSFKCEKPYGTITITGLLFEVDMNIKYKLTGQFIEHYKYGEQFKFNHAEKIFISTQENIVSFLSGSNFKGIGYKTAKKIVAIFQEETLEILKKEPNILLEHGFKQKIVDAIKLGISNFDGISNEIIRLKELGINDKILSSAKSKFKEQYLDILMNDIYYAQRHIKGLSIRIADHYASNIDKKFDVFSRELSLFYDKLKNHFFQTGDTYIGLNTMNITLDSKLIIDTLVKENLIVIKNEKLYLSPLFESEIYISQFLTFFSNFEKKFDVASDINRLEKELNIKYDDTQLRAIQLFFDENFLIVSGGPGTGKTTITKAMVKIYQKNFPNKKIAICAPTGRAAKRISELVGTPATTIHRLLKWDIDNDMFNVNENNPLDIQLLVIDECSMIDTFLFSSILKGCKNVEKILLIGDKDQLPSIAPGKVLQDLLMINHIPQILLSHNHRQKDGSGIIYFADDINKQKVFKNYENVSFLDVQLDLFFEILTNKLEEGYTDFQVLSSMYRGIGGIDYLNEKLQEKLNPPSKYKKQIKVGNKIYRVFDKILQLKNQVEENVYNGDIGIICDIDENEKIITVNFDGNIVIYDAAQIENITHGYCISIHKSQGSEYPLLFLFLPEIHQFMMEKRLIYTAVTRAKQELYVFGNKQLIESRVALPLKNERKTTLVEFIESFNYETL